jgi:signal transduction histidine kinase
MNAMPTLAGSGKSAAPSLRTEMLVNLAVLAAGALLLAVISALLAPLFTRSGLGFAFLAVLIGADVAIFIAFGRYLVSRLVTEPVERLVEATQAVADGRLAHRAPSANTREFDRLAESVNRMTDRLLDAQSALVHAEKLASVGRLAAGIAHEIGNPLSAIGTHLEVLRRRGADPELVASLERESGRIDAIVRSLLAYSRPGVPHKEPINLAEVVDGAVALLRSQGALKSVQVNVAMDGGVPRVEGDRTALEQVFVNILLNAVDAAGPSGTIAIVTSPTVLGDELPRRNTDPAGADLVERRQIRRSGRHLLGVADGSIAAQVMIGDSGPGVPADQVPRVFDPFFTTKPPGKGTGLGLAIAQRIIHDHGGRVDVGRAREGGAAFVVTLPGIRS